MARREEPIPAFSAGLSHVVLTGLFLAVALPPPARPPADPLPSAPTAGAPPAHAPATKPVAPKTLPAPSPPPVASSPSASPPAVQNAEAIVPDVWPEEDVTRGKEQCMHLLSTVAAEIEWLEPVKKGQCGLPAPVRLKSVGAGEAKVTFDPPVQVNCRMVAQLSKWIKASVQPKSTELFKSRVVRVVRASGYSCRNIYNRPNARLSQHALANAIDIGGFRLADGRTVGVLNGWGLTQRDIVAKAKAEAARKAKEKEAAAKGSKTGAADRSSKEADAGAAKRGGNDAETGGKAALLSGASKKNLAHASFVPPRKKSLTGDGKADGASADQAAVRPPTREARFLREIHSGACLEFGTVLGPEANDPHRNHFHLDLIARRGRGYCQ